MLDIAFYSFRFAFHMKIRSKPPTQTGFSLIELSIVLMIAGIMAAMAASAMVGRIHGKALKTTRENIDTVDKALTSYYIMNRHYPCPAPADAVYGGTAFAKAAEKCISGGTPVLSTTTQENGVLSAINPAGKGVAIGLVPFRSLGIPDSAGLDGWGNILRYAVTETLTSPASFKQTDGAIDIVSEDGKSRLSPPDTVQFVIVSTGGNGTGGYSGQGVSLSACPEQTPESENCDIDTTFMDSPPQAGQYEDGIAYTYDDIIHYRQYNPDLEGNGGLLLQFKNSCMKDFLPVSMAGQEPVGIETVAWDKQHLTDQSDDNLVLCYSSKYATKMVYSAEGGSADPQCPDQWTFIGYKFFAYDYSNEDPALRAVDNKEPQFIVCAR